MLVRTLPFIPTDPLTLWGEIHPHPRHGFFLGSGMGTDNDHRIYFSAGEPSRLLSFEEIKKNIRSEMSKSDLPRVVGFLGFEAGRLFDEGLARLPKKRNPLKTPTALFGEYLNVVKVDLRKSQTTISVKNRNELQRIIDIIIRRNGKLMKSAPEWVLFRSTFLESLHKTHSGAEHPRPLGFQYLSLKNFSSRVQKAKQAIARGDIYQANLSIRFERAFTGRPIDLYRLLCQRNPSPYAALIKAGPRWIVSCSPELLLSVEGRKLKTRPIAGTRPRGETVSKDTKLKGQLLLSPKERAEHIMLVDLERNDVGRVSEPGSVKVTERFAIERYSHVMHIVSEVKGRLQKGKTSYEALKAVFPGGTITGCPKIASVQIIEDLEGEARGPFYGSAGYFCSNGDAKFNILIRTALVQQGKIFVQAGAGIVADSKPAREYQETLAKAQALLDAISETLCRKSLNLP